MMRVERLSQADATWVPPRLVYSDVRLKREVMQVARLDNGINLYRYRYRWGAEFYVGVLAHEVAAIVPDAVFPDVDGFLRVNYRQLQMRLRTYQDWLQKGHAEPAPLPA
jgi:Chaperone of endosialidase